MDVGLDGAGVLFVAGARRIGSGAARAFHGEGEAVRVRDIDAETLTEARAERPG